MQNLNQYLPAAQSFISNNALPVAMFIFLLGLIFIFAALGLSRKNKSSPKIELQEEAEVSNNVANLMALNNSGAIFLLWPEGDDAQDEIGNPKFVGDKRTFEIACKKLELGGAANPTNLLLSLCEKSEDFKIGLEMLRATGAAFAKIVRGLEIVGRPIGIRLCIIIRPISAAAYDGQMLGFPIWKLDHTGSLIWGNEAFLRAVEMPNLETAIAENARLDAKAQSDGHLAVKGQSLSDTRAISFGGQRRIVRVSLAPANDGAIGAAIDVSDEVQAKEIAKREALAHVETLNHLNDAVVVFDANRRLRTYNSAFAQLWDIEETWLDDAPSHEHFLDRLREKSKLPHQSDFQGFKNREIAHYQEASNIPDETWTLPDGRIMRVMRQRQPTGGLLLLFEDISDKSLLQAQYKTQIEVSSATLDKLTEGVAVFSGDGKLTLANRAFFEIWSLDTGFMDRSPDFSAFNELSIDQYKDEEFWHDLGGRICDPSPEARQETQGQIRLKNDNIITWLTRPLPDGATLVAFGDVTAHHRMESVLREKAEALGEADKLKTTFLEIVSYQLRTPLNTISGYSELLDAGLGGALTATQHDYIGAIKTASEQLEKMVGDLLDLAVIEAGQAPLVLGDVNLHDVMEQAVDTAKTKLTDSQVNILVECHDDVGLIRADDKRIKQIMANLLNNALRNTRAGQSIKLAAKRFDDTIRLSVTSPKNEDGATNQKIDFDAFSEGSRAGGMGLVLVNKFVALHGGWVSMDSRDMQYATIICHLPVTAKPTNAAPELELV
ncbi:MAG: histidine kinase [Hyphomonadaceae bacterium]|nr:MAG: histidine kinase [Hyphomonadaceae bacterium]